MADSTKGVLKLSNGFKLIWGSENSTLLKSDNTVGGYSMNVSLSSFSLTNPVWCCAIPRYNQGFPKVAVVSISNSNIKLASDVSGRTGYYIQWMVIG